MEERLRKFAYLVDAGSFTNGATTLHVSQPALSAAIAKLERELKARLFVRGARPITLTPAGELAYQTAKNTAVQTYNLKLHLAELARQPVAVRIGMIDSLANTLFAQPSAEIRTIFSEEVSVVVNNSRYLTEAVTRGDLDIAFVAEQATTPGATLEVVTIATEPLVVVAHRDHVSVPGNVLPSFISYDQPSTTFRLVQRTLRDYGVVPSVSCYSTSPEVMLQLVLQKAGVAALPYLLVRQYLERGELQRLGAETPWLIHRPIASLKHRHRDLPNSLGALTRQVATTLDGLMLEAQR